MYRVGAVRGQQGVLIKCGQDKLLAEVNVVKVYVPDRRAASGMRPGFILLSIFARWNYFVMVPTTPPSPRLF